MEKLITEAITLSNTVKEIIAKKQSKEPNRPPDIKHKDNLEKQNEANKEKNYDDQEEEEIDDNEDSDENNSDDDQNDDDMMYIDDDILCRHCGSRYGNCSHYKKGNQDNYTDDDQDEDEDTDDDQDEDEDNHEEDKNKEEEEEEPTQTQLPKEQKTKIKGTINIITTNQQTPIIIEMEDQQFVTEHINTIEFLTKNSTTSQHNTHKSMYYKMNSKNK